MPYFATNPPTNIVPQIDELEQEIRLPLMVRSYRHHTPTQFNHVDYDPGFPQPAVFRNIDPRATEWATSGISILSGCLPPNTRRNRYAPANQPGTPNQAISYTDRRWPQSILNEGARASQIQGTLYGAHPNHTLPGDWQALSFPPSPQATVQQEITIWYSVAERIVALPWDIQYTEVALNVQDTFGAACRAIAEATDFERMAAEVAERSKAEFVRVITDRVGAAVIAAREECEQHNSTVRSYQRALGNALQEWHASEQRRLAAEKVQDEGAKIDPAAEWDALMRHPKITSVAMQGGYLMINTVELRLTNPDNGGSVPLGEMRIMIQTEHGDSTIRIENLTNPQQARAHPHVPDGEPCWGDLADTIYMAQASREYGGLIELLIKYLETYNPHDSWGHYARYWQAAAEENGTATEPGEAAENGDQSEDQMTALQRAAQELGIAQRELPPLDLTQRIECPDCGSTDIEIRSSETNLHRCLSCNHRFTPRPDCIHCDSGSRYVVADEESEDHNAWWCEGCESGFHAIAPAAAVIQQR